MSMQVPEIMMTENEIARIVVDTAFHIHQTVGSGLLESVYEAILARELTKRGLSVSRQQPVPIRYEDLQFEVGFRADLIVNDLVIVEIKSVERAIPQHKRQVLTYLRMTGMRLGLVINFWEPLFKDGLIRVVNGLSDQAVPIPRDESSQAGQA